MGVVQLLVDELAADVVLIGQGGARLASAGIEGALLPCPRWAGVCGGRGRDAGGWAG